MHYNTNKDLIRCSVANAADNPSLGPSVAVSCVTPIDIDIIYVWLHLYRFIKSATLKHSNVIVLFMKGWQL